MPDARALIRYAVFGVFAVSVLVASASWLVRTRRVSPFGALGRALRGASDPIIRPIEARLVRSGGNPVNAGWWLVIVVAVVGVVLLSLLDWAVGMFRGASWAVSGGVRPTLVFAIVITYRILVAALFIRVIALWFGYSRYTRWLRPVYFLTDWFVQPIQRLFPPVGRFDWTPLIALVALWLAKWLLLSVV